MESDVEASSVRHLFTWNEYFCSQGHQPISRLTLAATLLKIHTDIADVPSAKAPHLGDKADCAVAVQAGHVC